MAELSLNEQAKEIIRIAKESGVAELEQTMKDEGLLVTKEYVKGRKNLYSSPAVAEYNRTTDSANKTVTTLMKILSNFGVSDSGGEEDVDPLMAIINGN